MIEISDLHKFYGERRAIGPLSFSIASGEIVGLLGLNGAGKTTTLRILACDLLPSSGSVRVDGLDVVDQPHEVRQRIGYLPDRPPLYEEMRVHDFLVFAARLRGVRASEADKRASEAEEMTQLEGVKSEPIQTLSHGYKQRVGIAQAVVHRPQLLVLDEPISGLDPVQIVEMRNLLRGLKERHTILLSSHILSEISETCDRILVIKDGAIAASGTEAQLSQRLSGAAIDVLVRPVQEKGGDVLVEATMEAVEGVSGVERLSDDLAEAGGWSHRSAGGGAAWAYRVTTSKDARAEIIHALVHAGVQVLEVKRSARELETVFLELSARAKSPAKAQKEAV
ncbi:MAG: ABC transporter ATP-binding protein [Polyangiaceae bacterium]